MLMGQRENHQVEICIPNNIKPDELQLQSPLKLNHIDFRHEDSLLKPNQQYANLRSSIERASEREKAFAGRIIHSNWHIIISISFYHIRFSPLSLSLYLSVSPELNRRNA